MGGGPRAGRGADRKLRCSAEDPGVALVGAVNLERVMGIEPTLSAWEAEVLPLNYTRWGVPDSSQLMARSKARCDRRQQSAGWPTR